MRFLPVWRVAARRCSGCPPTPNRNPAAHGPNRDFGYAFGVRFDETDLAAFQAAEEVRIETSAPGGPIHRTITWIVVRDGVVYVRSVNGARGRWYREGLANPAVAVHVAGRRVEARAEPADDEASIAAASEALRDKYRHDPALRTMLREHTLPTTLRLEPAPA